MIAYNNQMIKYPQKQIPPELQWSGPRPRGFYNQFKQWQISPYSSQQQWTPEQIVRFQYRMTQGVMDPYRSHLDFTVQTDTTLCPVGGLQVDGSGHSFINQLVIQNRAVQIQRITEYSTLSVIVLDLGQDPNTCQFKQFQGVGHVNIGTNGAYSNSTACNGAFMIDTRLDNFKLGQCINPGLKSMTRAPIYTGAYSIYNTNQVHGTGGIGSPPSTMFAGMGGQILSVTNPVVLGGNTWASSSQGIFNGQLNIIKQMINNVGRLNNVRSQYMQQITKNSYPDTNKSLLHTCPIINGQVYDTSSIINFPLTGYNKNNPYKVSFKQFQTKLLQRNNFTTVNAQVPNNAIMKGFQRPFSQAFMQGTQQPMISPTIPQCQMQNGVILPQKIPISKLRLQIGLLSSVLGLFIPGDQFLLIPSQALNQTMLQITLDSFAMFTTGYRDIHQFDTIGMKYPQDRRGWIITNFYWKIHLYTFNQQNIRQYIRQSLYRGISISTNYYQLANQINISSGTSVSNRWNIMVLSQSLSQVYCRFYTTQFQTYSFCRKHFAVSNNIGDFQLKYNTQYFPAQPIRGNAGNPFTVDTSGDCLPFLQLIYWSQNYMMNSNRAIGRINRYNFCINSRCYDPTNKQTYYPASILSIVQNSASANDISKIVWDSSVFNFDTAMGMCRFNQNRYVGKGLYIWTWQPYAHGKTFLYGLNVTSNNQLHVIFNTISQTAGYLKDQILYIFSLSNALNRYTQNGIQVWGR